MNHSAADRRHLGKAGNTSVEFALFVMAGLLLMLCGADLVVYIRARMRLDQVSGSMAANITTYSQLYSGDFSDLFNLAQQTAGCIDVTHGAGTPSSLPCTQPYSGGATVFTGIYNPNGTPTVAWRQAFGDSSFSSNLGAIGGAPQNMPDSYAVPAGSSVVAVEVFTYVHPWIFSLGLMKTPGPLTLQSTNIFQPRSALLSQITPGNRP